MRQLMKKFNQVVKNNLALGKGRNTDSLFSGEIVDFILQKRIHLRDKPFFESDNLDGLTAFRDGLIQGEFDVSGNGIKVCCNDTSIDSSGIRYSIIKIYLNPLKGYIEIRAIFNKDKWLYYMI